MRGIASGRHDQVAYHRGMRDFKSLKIWQRAHALAIALHQRTRNFGRLGHARLRNQLTGAGDSVHDTIAEGCGAATSKEFARFLDMSIKSLNETEGHLLTARDLHLFSLDEWEKYNSETIEIRKMTYTYRRKVVETAENE
ncbi:MAG TPA: four helix bundle protein [Gemmatimonadaceae bacterium]|nr:four helix bundle protein [Gemmatimonadaceae bacterium]